jgi:hypothetical protein
VSNYSPSDPSLPAIRASGNLELFASKEVVQTPVYAFIGPVDNLLTMFRGVAHACARFAFCGRPNALCQKSLRFRDGKRPDASFPREASQRGVAQGIRRRVTRRSGGNGTVVAKVAGLPPRKSSPLPAPTIPSVCWQVACLNQRVLCGSASLGLPKQETLARLSTQAEMMIEYRGCHLGMARISSMPLRDAGWSSPVAREAHNLEVTGSNPVPAT